MWKKYQKNHKKPTSLLLSALTFTGLQSYPYQGVGCLDHQGVGCCQLEIKLKPATPCTCGSLGNDSWSPAHCEKLLQKAVMRVHLPGQENLPSCYTTTRVTRTKRPLITTNTRNTTVLPRTSQQTLVERISLEMGRNKSGRDRKDHLMHFPRTILSTKQPARTELPYVLTLLHH